jgi:hypothetical protein
VTVLTTPQITLVNADARHVEWPEADVCIADPAWSYDQKFGATTAHDHYSCMSIHEIAAVLLAVRARRLVLWLTWPMMDAWSAYAFSSREWKARWGLAKTGGSWHKSSPDNTGHFGPGYHWAGCSEPVKVYTCDGSYTDRSVALRNAWFERPNEHSRKPVMWQAQMIRKWCPEGGLVVDPFAGLASSGEAVVLAGKGRRWFGVEADPARFERSAQILGISG